MDHFSAPLFRIGDSMWKIIQLSNKAELDIANYHKVSDI